MRPRGTTLRAAAVGALIAASSITLAACGGNSKSDSSSSSTGATSTTVAANGDAASYRTTLDKWYKGTFKEPTGPAVQPAKGKNIWVISTGQSIETSQNASKGMQEAGKALGWNVKIFDGKFDSNRELSGIQQAIADKADGIVLLYIDCAPVKSGLQQAQKAGIKVVGIESADCNPSLEHVVRYVDDQSFEKWVSDSWGGSQAAWVVGKTDGQAKTIIVAETDLVTTKLVLEGNQRGLAACKTCEVVDVVEFVGADFGPALQQKIEQSLNRHPDANSMIGSYDAVFTSGGGAAALRSTGRVQKVLAVGGEGSTPGMDLIRRHAGMDACTGLPTAWEGYAAVDALVRMLTGQDPQQGVDSGIGSQICDREHNMPPAGESYQAPVDFVSAYKKLWGVSPSS